MKKVLIVSFYWPPSGKPSMHWPLKMAQYLPESGWEPVILTVESDTFWAEDSYYSALIKKDIKIIRTKFWDPFKVYKKLLGKKDDEALVASEAISKTNKSFVHRLSLWIRMNLFIPDARAGWIFSGFKKAVAELKKEKIDAVISNGPPHSTHLLAKRICKKFNIPLVTVFIDPWVDIASYKGQKRNAFAVKMDNKLERDVLAFAKKNIFVTKGLVEYFQKKYPFVKNKSELIHWGYNEEDFADLKPALKREYKLIIHAGNIYDHQNPKNFWITLKNEIVKGTKLKLKFIGTVSPEVKQSILDAGLENITEFAGFLPYDEVLKEMCSADYLLACTHEERHVPGKIFEYKRTGVPILAFGDNNFEVEELLLESQSGFLYPYNSKAEDFFQKAESLLPDKEKALFYDRRRLAGKLSDILEKL